MKEKIKFNKYFDHTILKPFINDDDLKKAAGECKKYDFQMLAINSCHVKRAKEFLRDAGVNVGAAIGFPLGQQTVEVKVFESQDAIDNGCDEIDYVINISELKNRNLEYVKNEMNAIVNICRRNNIISKVILEICYLTPEEIKECCIIANDVKPDFVKTSTGFGTHGATLEAVKLMRDILISEIQIKASGGIRDLKTALLYIDLGVTRIGTSNSIEILSEYKDKND